VAASRFRSRSFFGGRSLTIDAGSGLDLGCVLDNRAPITIGSDVSIGHQVLLLTSGHERGTGGKAAGPLAARPIVVGDGAWIGARALVLPARLVREPAAA
jgi:maltose O-acetyltransferase